MPNIYAITSAFIPHFFTNKDAHNIFVILVIVPVIFTGANDFSACSTAPNTAINPCKGNVIDNILSIRDSWLAVSFEHPGIRILETISDSKKIKDPITIIMITIREIKLDMKYSFLLLCK